jgi:predicted ATPase
MLRSVEFKNFKALRDTLLTLTPFTLILGPNGSGKSTALQAIQSAAANANLAYASTISVGVLPAPPTVTFDVVFNWAEPRPGAKTKVSWNPGNTPARQNFDHNGNPLQGDAGADLALALSRFRSYALDWKTIAQPVQLHPNMELDAEGRNFAGVLERLRDDAPEQFEAYTAEVGRWLPEYDRVLLNTPSLGQKGFALRTRQGKHAIPAAQLSQGTLLALAMLSLVYLPEPPVFIGLEEPDHGLHPRLLRALRDALYRLSHPEGFGEKRPPVQVVATTHSPYLLDLYREHPEEIVLAQKTGHDVHFERLSEMPNYEEILGDAPLSEVWYSGILGGVP